jgi:hypothetical protein
MNYLRDDVWNYGPDCLWPAVGPRALLLLRVRRPGFIYGQHGLAGWTGAPRAERVALGAAPMNAVRP